MTDTDTRTETEFVELLENALWTEAENDLVNVSTFESAGMLSSNAGLVVRLADGSEFQVTVVRSR